MLFREALPRAPKWTRRCALASAAAILTSIGVVASVASVNTLAHAITPLEVSAWAPDYSSAAGPSLAAHSSTMSESTLFFYSATSATTIATNPGGGKTAILAAAKAAQAATPSKPIIATVTDGMAPRVMATVLADPTQRAAHEQTLVQFITNNGFNGVDLDYEHFAFDDGRATWGTGSGGLDTFDNWGMFLTELSTMLHDAGKTLEVSVPPIYSAAHDSSSYWVYNYPVMATTVDRVKVMMYEYSGSKPGPTAPYKWDSDTMTYIKTVIDPTKLVLGMPTYGADWVTKVDGSCPVSAIAAKATLKRAPALSAIAQNAAKAGQTPTWNATTHELTYNYVESYAGPDANSFNVRCNVYRTVGYVDPQGIYDRAKLASDKGLAGVAFWSLGNESAAVWDALAAASAGQPYTAPAALATNLTAPAVVAPYPRPIDSPLTAMSLPARFLDTRTGFKTVDGLYAGALSGGKLSAGETLTLPIAGRGPIPGGTSTVALNVTVTNPTAAGYVTVYPCGDVPGTSSLNVQAGQTISNSVITKLSAGGEVCIFTQSPVDVIVDVFDILPDAGVTALATPARLLDTRAGQPTVDGVGSGTGALPINGVATVQVTGRGGVSSTAKSAILNVTAVGAAGNGYLTVWACDTPMPATSNVNFTRGAPIPNAVVTALSATGTVCVFANNATDVIVDVFGSLDPTLYQPLAQPLRLMDTRSGYTTYDGQASAAGKSALNQTTTLAIGGRTGFTTAPKAVVLNVTVDQPEFDGFVTVYPCGTAVPPVSNVNFAKGQTLPNLVVTTVSAAGTVCVFTSSPTHVIVDVFGTLALS
ncbi:MAG: hypothetical protein JWM34_3785 [Ilumatobacteraceae bacterium]|nr:hypothetical protein [Ilumatobacteraceae bacterium]